MFKRASEGYVVVANAILSLSIAIRIFIDTRPPLGSITTGTLRVLSIGDPAGVRKQRELFPLYR
jgi:hypothetical protein